MGWDGCGTSHPSLTLLIATWVPSHVHSEGQTAEQGERLATVCAAITSADSRLHSRRIGRAEPQLFFLCKKNKQRRPHSNQIRRPHRHGATCASPGDVSATASRRLGGRHVALSWQVKALLLAVATVW